MEEELFALKWNNHQSTFLRIIKSLRFKNLHTDATLACDGKFFSVHKFVLSTCSDYFNDIFHQTSCKCPVIVLKDVDRKNLEYLLDYMYIGEINVKQNELASLVNVAECLKIKGLAVPDEDTESFMPNVRETQSGQTCLENMKQSMIETTLCSDNIQTDKSISQSNQLDMNFKPETVSHSNEKKNCNVSENPFEISKVKLEPNETFLSVPPGSALMNGGPNLENSEDVMSHDQGNSLQDYFSFEEKLLSEGIRSFANMAGSSKTSAETQNPEWNPNGIQTLSGGFSPPDMNSESRLEKSSPLLSHQFLYNKSFGLKRLKRKLSHLKNSKVNYACPHCSYSCNDKSNFKRHVQIHTGEKPYHCPFCKYSTIHSSNLKTHIRNKHANDLTNHSQTLNFNLSSKGRPSTAIDSDNYLAMPLQSPAI